MQHQPQDVLIVGAGPAGLVLALSLLKNGVRVRIVDKATQHHVLSRGSAVQARIQEIEYFLGVLSDVQAVGMPTPMMLVYDSEDPFKLKRETKIFDHVDPTPQFPIGSNLMVNQYLHEGVFRSHVKAHGGTIELGTELSGLEQDENNVTVQLTKEVDGKQVQETASFAYVVGADGGHSVVRKILGLHFIGETYEEEQLITADVDLKGLEGYSDVGPKITFSCLSSPVFSLVFRTTNIPERYQVVLSGLGVAEIAQECADAGHEEFQSILRKFTKRNDLELLKIHAKLVWKYNSRMVDHFQKGRVFVAGDAAHAHSPMGGQGMTSSIQDSFNLAWKLALVVKGYASPSLLVSYEEERLPCIADMLLESSKLHRLVYNEKGTTSANTEAGKENNAIAQKTIDALGSAATPLSESEKKQGEVEEKNSKDPQADKKYFRGRKLFQLDLNYRWSPIVFDERRPAVSASSGESNNKERDAYGKPDHDLRAGDRAPDAPGLVVLHKSSRPIGKIGKVVEGAEDGVIRLFDTFDPTAHISLVFSSDQSFIKAVQDVLKVLPDGLIRTVLIVPQDASISSVGEDVDLVLDDKEGHAYKGYGIEKDANVVMIVRPDAMIGAFAASTAGVEQYLNKVFAVATA
ncbi:hypothetical protein ACEPAH_6080 [Sanghuangporus vaninii]